MLLFVLLVIDVLDLASANISPGAHTFRLADDAWILDSSWFAAFRSFAFDQTLTDQFVARNLKAVEVPNTDTALEEASILGAESCKFAHFLGNRDFKGFVSGRSSPVWRNATSMKKHLLSLCPSRPSRRFL